MATRMNVMKLVQEMRGMAQMSDRSSAVRASGPPLLDLRLPTRRTSATRRRFYIRISMQDPPDIPSPVAIQHRPLPSA